MPAEAPPLLPEEAAQVAEAVPRRRIEFATGRACARRALARLRIEAFALRNGPDRAPRWPAGVVGSITHTGQAPGGFCGVAVGRVAELRAVGLDAEGAEGLERSLWSFVLTPRERGWLDEMDPTLGGRLAKIIFSAKECFYKAQFPLSRRVLAFQDVEIALDPRSSAFEARLAKGVSRDLPLVACIGRYLEGEALVLAGVALPA